MYSTQYPYNDNVCIKNGFNIEAVFRLTYMDICAILSTLPSKFESEAAFLSMSLLLNEHKEDIKNGDTMGFCSLYRLIVY